MHRPYHRAEINKAFERVKAVLHAQANKRGNGKAFHIDTYTGAELWGGDRYDYDHIFPSEMIHSRYKDKLTDLEIAEVVNIPENIALTLRSINQSKGKKDPESWIQTISSKEASPIKIDIAMKAIEKAKRAIEIRALQFG
jgi:hypothetical protein